MNNVDNIHFQISEEILPIAEKLFLQQKELIQKLIPSASIEHVGSSAIRGALTIGDLDIQVRVTKDFLDQATEKLKSIYETNHPELWTNEFALFKSKDVHELPMSIVVTVINSRFDEFYKIRDLFRSDSNLLEKYNSLKRSYEGKPLVEYKRAKNEFFGPNRASNLLKYIK